jgi:hypothetical protein
MAKHQKQYLPLETEMQGYEKKIPEEEWMTLEILNMVEERKLAKENIHNSFV